MRRNTIQHTIIYNAQFNTIQGNTIQIKYSVKYNTIQITLAMQYYNYKCNTLQIRLNTMQRNTIQYNTNTTHMQFNTTLCTTDTTMIQMQCKRNAIQYNMTLHNTMQMQYTTYNTRQYNALHNDDTIQYNTNANAIPCDTLQIQYNTNATQYNTTYKLNAMQIQFKYNTIPYKLQ